MNWSEADLRAHQLKRETEFQRVVRVKSARQQAEEMAESEVEKQIAQFLTFKRIPFTFTKAENDRTNPFAVREGWPDITGCYSGQMLAIEAKATNGKLRRKQAEVLAELWEAGALICIARSVDDLQATIAAGKTLPATLAEISARLTKK